MLKTIGLVIVAVIVVFLGYVAVQPSEYVVSREVLVDAPAEKIFPYLNSSKLAERWGPWSEVDPQAKMVYSGPESGVGSRTSWDSEGQLGTGSATIVESIPHERVAVKLEYTKPMPMIQNAEYLIKPSEGGNIVVWRVQGENNFMGRLMCVFINMDQVVGSMFEKGLLNLKLLVETKAQ